MPVRLHILVTEQQRDCLEREADRTGLSVAELTRRPIDRVYRPALRPRTRGLEVSIGVWQAPDAAVAVRCMVW